VRPLVFESDSQVGGISRTVQYRGNRMDLGGHRFFSKSDWVMNWWQSLLPVAGDRCTDIQPLQLAYQGQRQAFTPARVAALPDKVMLVRSRLSRILYRAGSSTTTQAQCSHARESRTGLYGEHCSSYLKARLAPRLPE